MAVTPSFDQRVWRDPRYCRFDVSWFRWQDDLILSRTIGAFWPDGTPASTRFAAEVNAGQEIPEPPPPTILRADGPDHQWSQPRDLFRTSQGLFIVSDRFRRLLEQFDLGDTRFFPMTGIRRFDGQPYPDPFHLIQIRSRKDSLLAEACYLDDYYAQEARGPAPASLVLGGGPLPDFRKIFCPPLPRTLGLGRGGSVAGGPPAVGDRLSLGTPQRGDVQGADQAPFA